MSPGSGKPEPPPLLRCVRYPTHAAWRCQLACHAGKPKPFRACCDGLPCKAKLRRRKWPTAAFGGH